MSLSLSKSQDTKEKCFKTFEELYLQKKYLCRRVVDGFEVEALTTDGANIVKEVHELGPSTFRTYEGLLYVSMLLFFI